MKLKNILTAASLKRLPASDFSNHTGDAAYPTSPVILLNFYGVIMVKILAIGNSFSSDCTEYLYSICKTGNVDVKIGNLYIVIDICVF